VSVAVLVGANMRRLAIGLATLTSACATAPSSEDLPQVQAWLAAGGPTPPPQAQCPHVADVDLRAIAANMARDRDGVFASDRFDGYFNEVTIPEEYRRPPEDADVILMAVEPPGGMYANTIWSVVWREADGSWWFWRQNRDHGAPPPSPPPPPPPPPEGTPAYAEYLAGRARGEFDAKPMTDAERWPPVHGRLSQAKVASLERALNDPCRAWEPDIWPSHPPLRGRRVVDEPPPQDWTPIFVRIQERGRPARDLWAPSRRDSHVGTLRWIAYGPGV